MVDIFFVRYRIIIGAFQIICQVFGIGSNIISGQFFQIGIIIQNDILIRKGNAFIMKKIEKSSQINRVSQPGKCTGGNSD